MPIVLWVAAGDALESAARHAVNVWSGRLLGTGSVALSLIAVFAGLSLVRTLAS